MDLDGDGRADIISGSWPGEIYFFRRNKDGTFAKGEQLKDRHGQPLQVGSGSAAFAVDWNGNGTVDLLVGNVLGEVYLIANEGKPPELAFGKPRRLQAGGQPIKVNGDASPVAADWDGDGRLDLMLGAEDGSVVWYRNRGEKGREPKLAGPQPLVGKSPVGWGGDDGRRPGEWGLRVKICVCDYNGDGRLDLLMGDRCGGFKGRPNQTAREQAEEKKANDMLPSLRKQWAAAFRAYRRLQEPSAKEPANARRERERKLHSLREQLRRLKDEIALVQEIQERYQPTYQSHGFVWLFLRKPAAEITKKAGR